MITSTKNYTNKKWTDRTLRQMVKANLYRQKSQKVTYTYTLKKEKQEKYIYKKMEENNQINKQIYQ